MKWIVLAILIVNDQPIHMQVGNANGYKTIGECNQEMMRQVFQLHTASWSIRCLEVRDAPKL